MKNIRMPPLIDHVPSLKQWQPGTNCIFEVVHRERLGFPLA